MKIGFVMWLGAGDFSTKNKVYGYQDMKIEEYNRKGDWRWPWSLN